MTKEEAIHQYLIAIAEKDYVKASEIARKFRGSKTNG